VKMLLRVGCFALLLAGCVSGAGEFQWRYHEEYTVSEKNRQALMNLRQGMSLDEVRAMMGEPQMVDQYPSETIWYYRTRPTGLVSSTAGQREFPDRSGRGADTNFTPLVFDDRQRLVAWGKDVVLPERDRR
jgi:outer membrane protein assembly factor BamE (lipoprotein component of BamABCDE complex)